MDVTIVQDLEAVSAEEWRRLVDRTPSATVFQELGWLRAWWATCAPAGAVPHVALVHDRSGLIGAAPFYRGPQEDAHGRPGLGYIGAPHSDYNVLLAVSDDARVLARLLAALEASLPRGGVLTLPEVPEHSATARLIAARVRRLGCTAAGGRTLCPRLGLRALSGEGASVLGKHGFRRHARRLQALGRVAVEHLVEAAAIAPHLPAFFDQHQQRWAATPYPSLFVSAHNRRLYERVAMELAPAERILFTVVTVDGAPAAYHFGLLSQQDLLWYKPSFDVALAKHSPGQALLHALVAWCVEHGRSGLDFTRGDEAFKARLATESRANVSFSTYASVPARLHAGVTWMSTRVVRKAAALLNGRATTLPADASAIVEHAP